jgi:hypothetical protein
MRILWFGARLAAALGALGALSACSSSQETGCSFQLTRDLADASVMDSGFYSTSQCQWLCGQAITQCWPVSGQSNRVECQPYCL